MYEKHINLFNIFIIIFPVDALKTQKEYIEMNSSRTCQIISEDIRHEFSGYTIYFDDGNYQDYQEIHKRILYFFV
jgi:hypothetical protein